MSIFDAYHDEFAAVTGDISRQISHVISYDPDPKARRNQLRQADAMIGQANDLLKQMEIEVRSTADKGTKADLQSKVASYKKTLTSLRRDYQNALEREEREGLMLGASADRQVRDSRWPVQQQQL
jgi:hypothetical protein